MQKLFENWRKHLKEADDAAQEMRNRIAAHQGVEPTPARSGQEIANELGYNQDPDSDDDDTAELRDMSPEINRALIEKTIEDFSFNSAQSSQHRWSPRQPIIDYRFDSQNNIWVYTAHIPDGTNNADNWPAINSEQGEHLVDFLTRIKENPHQLNLALEQHKKLFENWRRYQKNNLKEISGAGGAHEERVLDSIKSVGQDLSMKGNIKDEVKDEVYREIWNYSETRSCHWWGPCKKLKNGSLNTIDPKKALQFDSHKHILAAALYTSKYSQFITRTAGWLREKWQSIGGGEADPMDLANNDIGISIGIKYSDFEDSFIDRVVLKEIKNGNFYVRDGETMWKDATPEQKK